MITPRQLYFQGMGTGAMLVIGIDHLSNGNFWRAGISFALAVVMFLWMITTTRPPQSPAVGQASR